MSDEPDGSRDDATPSAVSLAAVAAIVSAAVLGYEIALMRVLLVAGWHHFASVVISLALLGLGASGTMLALWRQRLTSNIGTVLLVAVAAVMVAMPLCAQVAQHVPVELRPMPGLVAKQVAWWLVYGAVLWLPFFLGGSLLGLTLMAARQRVGLVYAGNLLGSGAGAIGVLGLMYVVPPAWLAVAMSAAAWPALACVPQVGRSSRVAAMLICAGIVAIGVGLEQPHIRPDPYKYAAHLARLAEQGQVQRLDARYGPRGVVELYRSDLFHDLPFLSVDAMAPLVDALVIDGHWVAPMLRTTDPAEAEALDHTLMATAYALTAPRPRVLLLGDPGEINLTLALRQGAAAVDHVQPDPNIAAMMSDLSAAGSLQLSAIRRRIDHPRHFVEANRERYDLIQLAVAEQITAGSGGVGGLAEDYLLTIEGIVACLDRLDDDGVLSICRGIQTPPRDNLKLLALLTASLRQRRVDDPSAHIVIIRDFLGVCTLVRPVPWTAEQIEHVRQLCALRQLTPVWFTGIRDDELNQPDALPAPEGSPGDWYHFAARRLFTAADAAAFIDDYLFDIRPPTDARPFFADFGRLRAIPALRDAMGDLWLTRVELAFLFAVGAVVVVGVAAVVLGLLPLALLPRSNIQRGRAVTAGYFGAIGMAFMMIEITALARLTHLVGDTLVAAGLTIGVFLVGSGVGSLAADRWARGSANAVRGAVALIIVLAATLQLAFAPLTQWTAHLPLLVRCVIAAAFIAPLAFAMGIPMPTALRRLDVAAPPLIPWAWGINGFFSVLATPLTTVIAMAHSYHPAAIAALVAYALAALLIGAIGTDRPSPVESRRSTPVEECV